MISNIDANFFERGLESTCSEKDRERGIEAGFGQGGQFVQVKGSEKWEVNK